MNKKCFVYLGIGIILGILFSTLSAYLTSCRSGGVWHFYCYGLFQLGLGIIMFLLPLSIALYLCKRNN